MEITVNKRVIKLVEGDITEQDTDAIVNAANMHLQLGSGVAGAINAKGGPSIQRECDKIGGCPVGGAVITGGGNLKARRVIHAVGPYGSASDADEKLITATRNSLKAAEQNGLTSIAFPALSTGVFGYPVGRCAENMLATVREYLAQTEGSVTLVIFCLYGQNAFQTFAAELERTH